MSAKHTPTPWRTTNDHANKICDQVGRKIAVCPTHSGGGQWRDREEADANAAFIVRACNAHDDLVAALKSAVRQLRAYEAAATGEDYNDTQINAALEKAGAS